MTDLGFNATYSVSVYYAIHGFFLNALNKCVTASCSDFSFFPCQVVPIFGKNERFFRFLRRAAGRFSGVSEKKFRPQRAGSKE